MGTDIHGWIERRNAGEWLGVTPLTGIQLENYDMFGCLFGVRNYAHFRPIAPSRGLPEDVSSEAQATAQEWESDGHSHTWITLQEIAAIDWHEPAQERDERIHMYRAAPETATTQPTDTRTPIDKVPEMPQLNEQLASDAAAVRRWEDEHRIVIDDTVYAQETVRRATALSAAWQQLFDTMATLARDVGTQHVRLVVWFDS